MIRTTAVSGLLAAALVAGCGKGVAPAQLKPQPLPTGPLQALPATVSEARYLVDGSLARAGADVAVAVLVVSKTGTGIEQKYALMTKRESVDCAARSIRDEGAALFDVTGRQVEAKFLTGSVGREAGGADTEVAVVCDAAAIGKGRTLAGWQAAQRDFQAPPTNLPDIAKAHPDDAHAWAWLCGAGARGRWRPQTPADCDHAVKLSPDDAAVRLDRGFLKLAAGNGVGADPDFRAVLARQPNNAPALFGHGLVAALRGGPAAGKADRVRAMDLEPKVADWLESRYSFLIGDPFKAR